MATIQNVGLEALRQAAKTARDQLLYVRSINTTLQRDVGRMQGNLKYTEAARETEVGGLREEAQRQARDYLAQKQTLENLAAAAAQERNWTRETFVKRARFTPTLSVSSVTDFRTDAERARDATAADVLESSEAQRWLLTLQRAGLDELRGVWADAQAAKSLALLGAVLREARYRADRPDTWIPKATEPGAQERKLLADFNRELQALPMPEIDEAVGAGIRPGIFDELRGLQSWIDSAVRALVTGDDPGVRAEERFRLAQQGHSGGPFVVVRGHLEPAEPPAAA